MGPYLRTAPYVVSNGSKYNGAYHYYGRADTYFHIGQAFGRGALRLLKSVSSSKATSTQVARN